MRKRRKKSLHQLPHRDSLMCWSGSLSRGVVSSLGRGGSSGWFTEGGSNSNGPCSGVQTDRRCHECGHDLASWVSRRQMEHSRGMGQVAAWWPFSAQLKRDGATRVGIVPR